MDGWACDGRKAAVLRCLPSWVPRDDDTVLNVDVGKRSRLLSFRCSCQSAKVKVHVTLDDNDAAAIGARFAHAKALQDHAACFKLAGAIFM